MRHLLAPLAVPLLAQRVPKSARPAPLVRLPGVTLTSTPRASRAVGAAVPVPRHVAHRAQRQDLATRRVLANNKLQRDHGPKTRCSTSARTYATQHGSLRDFTVQRSDRGHGGRLSVSSLCASSPTVARSRTPSDDLHREHAGGSSRRLMPFTAIGDDFLRRDQQDLPPSGSARSRPRNAAPSTTPP